MKWIDLPPIWLLGFAVLAWLSRLLVQIGGPLSRGIGTGLVGLGLILMALAVWEMSKARTTVIPRRDPDALVASGIFRFSRNPIYLGDALVLAGLSLRWDAPLGLILVAGFVAVIQARFIKGEEARLSQRFGPRFEVYQSQTRRWF